MKVMKIIFMIATITLALTLTLTTLKMANPSINVLHDNNEPAKTVLKMPSKRVSRFLAEDTKYDPPRADHCHKDEDICYFLDGKNSTCCNNKCVEDYKYDKNHCGKCKHKCEYTETCCRGQCVDLDYDKRHCGVCNNRCQPGRFCIYGMCDYA